MDTANIETLEDLAPILKQALVDNGGNTTKAARAIDQLGYCWKGRKLNRARVHTAACYIGCQRLIVRSGY